MSDWTLGKLKAQNMQIHARCTNERCGQSYVADPETLIPRFGAEADLSVLQNQTCEACNAPLSLSVAFKPDDDDFEDETPEIDDGRDDRHWD